ncbi:restriction endonuclease subunit S [Klebsiella pneumoniae]|uniref:restriction endonuclease subunit S n=1 Tax=Klebsiella pneumoniae TaxID=573 RepID=UPI00165DB8A5|nr:restriction endonuclease subunit S [Klebsiella pneumoniae]MBD3911931.1 restriction endonuclease subunit S [Klebsiella pneumoniae]
MSLLKQRKNIPDDWINCELGEVLTLQRGYDLPHRLRKDGEVPIISSSGVSGRHDKAMVSPPGVVTGRYETIGEIFYVNEPFWPLNTTLYVRDFRGMTAEYAYHYLKTINFASHSGKSGIPGVNRNDVHKEIVYFPINKIEQTAIVNILTDTDVLITELENLISKKQAIKTATMQQLLTGRTRLTQFAQYPYGTIKNYKSSELGLIPEDWEVARLAQVAKVIDPHPSHRAPPEESYGVPFVGIGDMNESGELINSEVRRVNQSILQEHSERYTLHNQPIGLGRVASIGKVIRLRLGKEPYAISPTLGVIDGFACTNDFLFYYLKSESVTEQFSRVMSGSTRSSVGMNVLKEILVVKISIEEQISIAAILSDMDAELKALEQKLAKFRAIKQGMMQQLLTGRIRLPLEQQP